MPQGDTHDLCQLKVAYEHSKIFDSLRYLDNKFSTEVKETLVYITGYVTKKDTSSENETSSLMKSLVDTPVP